MEPEQAAQLGRLVRSRRTELGLTIRQLAEQAGMNFATVARIEQGQFAAPGPDKLARIAGALGLSTADVFGLAAYTVPSDLPTFKPYLRSRYPNMPARAIKDLERYFDSLAERYGIDPAGPAPGEDEAPAPRRKKQ